MKIFHLILPLVLLTACGPSGYETKDFGNYGPSKENDTLSRSYGTAVLFREGTNELRREVINTWSNRIVGDLFSEKKFTNMNVQRGASGRSWSETPLLISGLLGLVKITVVRSDLR